MPVPPDAITFIKPLFWPKHWTLSLVTAVIATADGGWLMKKLTESLQLPPSVVAAFEVTIIL